MMTTVTTVYGTKCAGFGKTQYRPESISEVWADIAQELGPQAVNKPIPGQTYRKLKKSLTNTDGPTFREMPDHITITSLPKLFESTGWKYKGRCYISCESYWRFHYTYTVGNKIISRTLPLRILSHCYAPTKVIKKPVQLSIF